MSSRKKIMILLAVNLLVIVIMVVAYHYAALYQSLERTIRLYSGRGPVGLILFALPMVTLGMLWDPKKMDTKTQKIKVVLALLVQALVTLTYLVVMHIHFTGWGK